MTTSRPVLSANLTFKQQVTPSEALYELRCVDAVTTLSLDVTFTRAGGASWTAEICIGGKTLKPDTTGCEAPTQAEVLQLLADWTRRAQEGLALVSAPEARVQVQIMNIANKRAEPTP